MISGFLVTKTALYTILRPDGWLLFYRRQWLSPRAQAPLPIPQCGECRENVLQCILCLCELSCAANISVANVSGHLVVILHNKVAMSHITALISFSSSAVIIFSCIVSLCAGGTVSVRTRPHTEASCIRDTLVLGTFWCFGPSPAPSSPFGITKNE